jgi:hypothetical protein
MKMKKLLFIAAVGSIHFHQRQKTRVNMPYASAKKRQGSVKSSLPTLI